MKIGQNLKNKRFSKFLERNDSNTFKGWYNFKAYLFQVHLNLQRAIGVGWISTWKCAIFGRRDSKLLAKKTLERGA